VGLRVRRAFLTAIGVIALLHLYIGWRLLPALPIDATWKIAGALLLVASWLLLPLGMLVRRTRQPWADRIAWAAFLTMGLFSSLLVFTLLRDVTLLAMVLMLPAPTFATVVSGSASIVVAGSLIVTGIGLVNARRRARVTEVEIPIVNLSPALRGFSIVQITDVHVGPTIKRDYVAAIVEAVNALDADAIAITGDLVDGRVQELRSHIAPLGELKARDGVYFVTGNHEYYSGVEEWTRELSQLGIRVLTNEHVVLERAGVQLVLAGVPDFGAHHYDRRHRSDPAAALARAPANAAARVLLAHQPRSAPAAAEAGFDLQLSGHTHGGQFWPWNHFVRFQQPYTAGLHRLRSLWVYTSRGTGYWGPPKRFGAPSEITLIRLSPANPSAQ
jgi:predicted MPP superfamily phosphohydrolase